MPLVWYRVVETTTDPMDHHLLGARLRNETRHAAEEYPTGVYQDARAARGLRSAPLSHGSYARAAWWRKIYGVPGTYDIQSTPYVRYTEYSVRNIFIYGVPAT